MRSNGNNIFIVLFILVVIGFIGGAVYILYYSKNTEEIEDEEIEEINEVTDVISVVGNLKMSISEFDTMNPLLTRNREIINLDKLIFEPLVSITDDYKTENCLAKTITKTSETEYEVKLNPSIKWQDGSSFMSRDVQFTVEKLKEVDSIYSPNVRFIENIDTPDSETAIITLTQDVPFFEYYLDFPILSKSYYLNEDFQTSNKIPIGTGMYKIASIDDDNIFLIRNDRWIKLKEKTPRTESITIHKSNSAGEVFNSFKLGNIDAINTYMTNYSEYVGTMGYNKKEYPGRYFCFLSLNCSDSMLEDAEIRKAINYAINRDALVSSVFEGIKMSSYGPLDYGSYLHDQNLKVNYSQEESKRILETNGWVYTNDRWQKNIDGYVRKLTLSLVVNEDDEEKVNVANNIKNQLEDVGIIINIARVTTDRYAQYLSEKNYQMILTGVTNSINPDLSYFYGENNLANYYNEDNFSNIYKLEKYSEIQRNASQDVPYVGLYRNKGTLLLNANVGGTFLSNSYFTYFRFNEWYRQQ